MTIFAIILLMFASATSVVCHNVTATTGLGNITGHTTSFKFIGQNYSLMQFLGIPYAEPPNRFEKAEPKTNFTEPFVANESAAMCYQNPAWIMMNYGVNASTMYQSEDCLYLNIYIPGTELSLKNQRAVLVWIHGGGFNQGTQDWYNAKALVALNNIIMVTISYRVSVFGFLSLPVKNGLAGNYGLWDQKMALEFIHQHISSFGGDPLRVTIAGESAGGSSVVYQALHEDNEGLFQRAIAQSGSVNNGFAYENDPASQFWSFAETEMLQCNVSTPKSAIDCLKNKPVGELITAVALGTCFKPVVDNDFVTVHPVELFQNQTAESWRALKRFGKIDLIIGLNSADGALLLGFIAHVLDALGDNPTETAILNTFESVVLPLAMSFGQLEQSELINNATVNQYLNWSAPASIPELMQKSTDLFTDTSFNAPGLLSAKSHHDTQQNGSLYLYIFDRKLPIAPNDRYAGANHEDEMIYVLGMPEGRLDFYFQIQLDDQASLFKGKGASWDSSLVYWNDINLSLKMMEYWTNFVKTGNPNIGDEGNSELTNWPEYDVNEQEYIRFVDGNGEFPIEQRYAAGRMHFWHHFVPYLRSYEESVCQNKTKK